MRTVPLPQGLWVAVAGPEQEYALRYARASEGSVEVAETDQDSRLILASGAVDPFLKHAMVQTKTAGMPKTVFRGVWQLPPGDSVEFRWDGVQVEARLPFDHPWLSQHLRYDVEYSTQRLEELLVEGVEAALAGERNPILLLSEGKDSVPLARALYLTGVKAHCITFGERNTDTYEFARHIAQKYGHSHELVTAQDLEFDKLLEECARLPHPSADQAVLAYAWLAARHEGRTVLDGQRAEMPMGFRHTVKESLQCRLRRLSGLDPRRSVKSGRPIPAIAAYGVSWPSTGWRAGDEACIRSRVRTSFRRLSHGLPAGDIRLNIQSRGVTVDYNNKGSLWELGGMLLVRRPWGHQELAEWFAHGAVKAESGTSRGWLLRYLDEVENYSAHIRGKRGFQLPVNRLLEQEGTRHLGIEPGPAMRRLLVESTLRPSGPHWSPSV